MSLKRFSSIAILSLVGILAAAVAIAPDAARSLLVDVAGDRVAALLLGPASAGGVMFALMQLPAAKNMTELAAMRNPPEGAVDVYPDVLYSTMTFPAAGQPVGTPLQFFQGAETNPRDISLTNVANGFLVAQRFHALYAFVVPIIENTSLNAATLDGTGRVRDLDRVLKTNRGFVSYTYSVTNKTLGPFPLDAFGEMGAIMPDFGGNNAPAAGSNAVYQHVRTGASGGWPLNLIIYENEGFPFNMTWGVQTAITADLPIRLVLFGWRYVKNAA